MSDETSTEQIICKSKDCGGRKKAMLAYGVIQISATVLSAISLAAIALGFFAVKQESKLFNGSLKKSLRRARPMPKLFVFVMAGTEQLAPVNTIN